MKTSRSDVVARYCNNGGQSDVGTVGASTVERSGVECEVQEVASPVCPHMCPPVSMCCVLCVSE